MTIYNKIILTSIFLLIGCNVETVNITAPSGSTGAIVKCGQLQKCREKAGQVCPMGYNVIESDLDIFLTGLYSVAIECSDAPDPSMASMATDRVEKQEERYTEITQQMSQQMHETSLQLYGGSKPTPTVKQCSSNLSCDVGTSCIKGPYDSYGFCAKPE